MSKQKISTELEAKAEQLAEMVNDGFGFSQVQTQIQKVKEQEVKDAQDSAQVFQNAESLTRKVKADRKEVRRALGVAVKHNTPIEQVCMSATLYDVIREALSLSPSRAILGKLGGCEAVRIVSESIPSGVYALYQSAKRARAEGKLGVICEMTDKGVKADKYAFEFAIIRE